MSSFLKSAAMTILSRMIQALLSKYIVDVDVEGIAFPSMISSYSTSTDSNNNNNTNNNGFGMRLRNVKLRNGAKLMNLPGKLPSKQQTQGTNQETQTTKSIIIKESNSNETIRQHNNTTDDSQHQTKCLPFNTATTVELQELVLYDVEKSSQYSATTPLLLQHNNNNTKSTKKKVSWMSSWFPSSTPPLDTDNDTRDIVTNGPQQHIQIQPIVESTIPVDFSVNDCENGSPLWMKPSSSTSSTTTGIISQTTTTTATRYTEPVRIQSSSSTSTGSHQSSLPQNDDNINSRYQDRDETSTMILRLGDDCVIGTLDVRRIGKTMHVLIEDMILNLDVVRIRNDCDNNKSSNSTSDNSSSNNSTKQPIPTDKTGSNNNKVLAENSIARFFALLPNLFIHNARIRLTIRDNYDDDNDVNDYDSTVDNDNLETTAKQYKCSNDAGIVEIVIDNLTITDGEDFVSKLRSSKNNEESQEENDKEVENEEEDDDGNDENDNSYKNETSRNVAVDDDDDDDDNDSDSDESGPKGTKSSISAATMSSFYADESNVFITRRIRTGTSRGSRMIRKGQAKSDVGSITVRVYPPTYMHSKNYISHRIHRLSKISNQNQKQQQHQRWARDSFLSESGNVMLRCTGLDLQAQIFVGTKKRQRHREMIISHSTVSLPYNDAILDSMISGCVDYVVPGPDSTTANVLPPMFLHSESNTLLSESDSKDYNDSYTDPGMFDDGGPLPNLYNTDTNGIQSCRIPSIFHKVSRGLVPESSNAHCLPCEENSIKWNNPGSVNDNHPLDTSIPLAGLTLHVSVKECLEINADRQNLETIGVVLSLFQKKSVMEASLSKKIDSNTTTKSVQKYDNDDNDIDDDRSESSAVSARTEVSLFCKSPTRETLVLRHNVDNEDKTNEIHDSDTGFPSYMQPEKIQILGIYISKASLRIHCMKDSTNRSAVDQVERNYLDESGISFCYWHANASCLTMDVQTMNAIERPFQDIRLDCNYLKVVEYKGLNERQLLDTKQREQDEPSGDIQRYPLNTNNFEAKSFHETTRNYSNGNTRSSWPSTAAVLMDIPPLFESIKFESRKDHAVQCRFININNYIPLKDVVRRNLVVNLRNVNADAPFPIWRQIPEIINEIRYSIFGRPAPGPVDKRLDSRLKFSIRSNGGHVYLEPIIKATVPIPIVVNGEYSTTAGVSFQTSIDETKFTYGTCTKAPVLENNLTLQQLASLPEMVRLRILLFLQDLAPLEKALGIENTNVAINPFRRQQNVNHAIVQQVRNYSVQNQQARDIGSAWNEIHSTSNGMTSMNRRQLLLSRLSQLDDDTLDYLLTQSTKLA
jgi:hypothetical protein